MRKFIKKDLEALENTSMASALVSPEVPSPTVDILCESSCTVCVCTGPDGTVCTGDSTVCTGSGGTVIVCNFGITQNCVDAITVCAALATGCEHNTIF